MKIAHISPEFYPAIGGVGQAVRELAKRQVMEGHEVHVYAPAWDKEKRIPPGDAKIDGIFVHRVRYWFKAVNFMTFWPGLFLELARNNFDVIHSHLFAHPHFVIASLAAKLKKTKHIHTTHCPWSDAPRSLLGEIGILVSYNLLSRFCLRFLVDTIIAITPWEFSFIEKYGGKGKIVYIPNGVDEIFFKRFRRNDFKRKYGIKEKLVLFFGRLNYTKGPEQFVEIAKIILSKREDVSFLIIGPDEGMQEEVLRRVGNEKKIKVLGAIRDRIEIAKMYQAANIYVMPSYREGLPLTLFEAMASGCPIVASAVNGIPFEMKEPENGFLVSYGENNKFAKRIIELLNNRKLREKISKNNKKLAKKYNWDGIARKTMQTYMNSTK
ncbi:glycosyltransferase family 1 protein [Candidatus Pacearchaeota archaeon]|nr:MAG: glycosyltransferase family 1 protein [Candidatus Pacearchaeota archaeon]